MIGLTSSLDTLGMDNFMKRLPGEMALAVQFGADLLHPIAENHIEHMGIIDTGAYIASLYVSVNGNSQYDEAVQAAGEAYAHNPSAYPWFKEIFGGELKIDPPLVAHGPEEAYLGVAASHGKYQEEGFVSPAGNDIPARPAIAQTAADGYPEVVKQFKDAMLRAIR